MSPITQLSEFQQEMLATLAGGGSVKVTPRPGQEGLAAEVKAAMDQLVDAGLARVSGTGRYWAAQGTTMKTAHVGEGNARWLAGPDSVLAGTSLKVTDNGDGTVTFGQDVADYLAGLPGHYDGSMDRHGYIYIAGDAFKVARVVT